MHSQNSDSGFPTTQWTEMEDLRQGNPAQQQALIASLYQRYHRPVRSWLRFKGYSLDKAEDLTQGFFCDIVMERGLVNRADRKLGRFRTFLLTALKAFVSDEYRKVHALKRRPEMGFVQIDDSDIDLPVSISQQSPDEVFIYMWASDFLKEVFAKLEAEYAQAGRETHWEVFKQKIYDPMLKGVKAPSYEKLCAQCNIEDAQKAAAMVTTVKRRFRSFLRSTLRPQVESEEAIDQEIQELFQIFSRMDA